MAINLDPDAGLVLEGGGMRGVFTSGALDYLMDRRITFPYCVSVSAGACNGTSYLSGQRGRARRSNIDLYAEHRYIGMRYLWTQHSILDRETIYDTIPNRLLPFDYEAAFANPMEFEMVTTDCLSGLPCYLSDRSDRRRFIDIVKASSALPYVCPVVWVDRRPMLDGGIVDSIPVERAMARGHAFNVVILTRNRGYREHAADIKVPKYIYRRFPRLRLALSKRHACYNRQLELVEQLEDAGRILAIRPSRPLEVGRLETDTLKLAALYEEGYACARRAFEG